ncbi:MAG: hypothetical protein ACRDF9_15620, partial [Candidatus Limnocylindria bacterium]
MRGLARRLIFVGVTGTSQLSWIRAASRHLRHGGVVLLFPAGRLEPDPAVLGRDGALLPWSDSLALIARLAPETQVVPAAVSGVLSGRAFAHPLTRIRRAPRDRQRVATLLQMIDPRYRSITARVAFGAPVEGRAVDLTAILASRTRDLLFDPPTEWIPLGLRSPDPATTAA